jgi:hypothetical protein
MTLPKNSYEMYVNYNQIFLSSICNVIDNGEGLSLRVDFKDCNIPVYLDGNRKHIFLTQFWDRRLELNNNNSMQFLINGFVLT